MRDYSFPQRETVIVGICVMPEKFRDESIKRLDAGLQDRIRVFFYRGPMRGHRLPGDLIRLLQIAQPSLQDLLHDHAGQRRDVLRVAGRAEILSGEAGVEGGPGRIPTDVIVVADAHVHILITLA
jgi:hypothetical protein